LVRDGLATEPVGLICNSSSCSLGVDSRHQDSIVSAVDIMTRIRDVLSGTLDMLIWRTLQRDALHGWAISARIRAISEDGLQVDQGSLSSKPSGDRELAARAGRGRWRRPGFADRLGTMLYWAQRTIPMDFGDPTLNLNVPAARLAGGPVPGPRRDGAAACFAWEDRTPRRQPRHPAVIRGSGRSAAAAAPDWS
jgi:hypothetical protein